MVSWKSVLNYTLYILTRWSAKGAFTRSKKFKTYILRYKHETTFVQKHRIMRFYFGWTRFYKLHLKCKSENLNVHLFVLTLLRNQKCQWAWFLRRLQCASILSILKVLYEFVNCRSNKDTNLIYYIFTFCNHR